MREIFTPDVLNILGVTLQMSFFSTVIGSALGIVCGLLLEKSNFPLKKIVVRISRTLMGTPPVVAGLVVYLLLMRRGPLGSLNLLFTIRAMVIAQVLIITPIVCSMVYTHASRIAFSIRTFAKTMGASPLQTNFLIIKESRSEIYFAIIAAFSRSISEVGSVLIVGGNIQNKTRVMTGAIALMRNMGNFREAITLGVFLLIIAFTLQTLSDFFHKSRRHSNEFYDNC